MRTKGATSNVLVSLRQLNRLFNEDAMIPIARRFADENGMLGKAIHATNDNLKAAGNQPAIEERIAITEIVEPEATPTIPNCPNCNGERELDGAGGYICHFCGLNEHASCKKCGSPLHDEYCTDQACPYSSHKQNETWSEG